MNSKQYGKKYASWLGGQKNMMKKMIEAPPCEKDDLVKNSCKNNNSHKVRK